MSAQGALLQAMSAELAAAAPARLVTRSLRDFAARSKTDLARGVFTLVSRGRPASRGDIDYVEVLLVGQIALTEKSAGENVEEAELLMLDEVARWAKSSGVGQIEFQGIQQSQQVDAPYGWLAVRLRVGPLDLGPYAAADESLDAFELAHAAIDVATADGTLDSVDDIELPQ